MNRKKLIVYVVNFVIHWGGGDYFFPFLAFLAFLAFLLSCFPAFLLSFLKMTTRNCEYTTDGEDCMNHAVLADGQNRFCMRHHVRALSTDAQYNARVLAYQNDPELVAAQAAYDTLIQNGRLEAERAVKARAEEARRNHVPVEIPLEKRTYIRITGAPTWTAESDTLGALCHMYGAVGSVSIHCDKSGAPTGIATVGFVTHEDAAATLSALDGMEQFGTTLKTSWKSTHTRAVVTSATALSTVAPDWGYEYTPAARSAKHRLVEAQAAARERQEPGILAREAAERAAEQAEREAEEAEDAREAARRDAYEREEWEAERKTYKANKGGGRRCDYEGDEW